MEETIVQVNEKKNFKKGLKARLYVFAEKMLRHNAMLAVAVIIAGICMAGAPDGSTIFDQTTACAAKAKSTDDPNSSGSESAADADGTWDNTMKWIAKWVTRLGGVIALLGVIEVGMGIYQDNPSAKTIGWKMIAGGGIVAAAGVGYNQFI